MAVMMLTVQSPCDGVLAAYLCDIFRTGPPGHLSGVYLFYRPGRVFIRREDLPQEAEMDMAGRWLRLGKHAHVAALRYGGRVVEFSDDWLILDGGHDPTDNPPT
ncbi:MAG: hypothetical protein ACYC1C_13500 [Chloroflexota bacterium]